MDPTILIDSADHAVNNAPSGGRSREVIHRAISTAYYAVNASNAGVQHGIPVNAATARAWDYHLPDGCATASQPEISGDTCSS